MALPSDEVAGEYLERGELGDIENRAASLLRPYIYGKNKVSAESPTAAFSLYARHPWPDETARRPLLLEGINTLLHVYITQAADNSWA